MQATAWDVIVVGAGAAGLACARSLAAAGFTVVTLEARERTGGRILTLRRDGEPPVEGGAQVVHGERAATWDVLREAGLQADPMALDEPFAIVAAGERHGVEAFQRAGILAPWLVEQRLIGARPPDRPALELLAAHLDETDRRVMHAWLEQLWCAEPERLSAAGMAAVRGGWRAGQRDFVLPGGYDAVVAHLARGLDVRLGTAVHTIARGPDGVVLTSGDGTPWRARRAVVTMPPSVVAAGDVAFEPALPDAKAAACASIGVGDALTVVAAAREPASRSGWALAVDAPAGFWRVRAGSRLVQGSFKGRAAGAARELLGDPRRLLLAAGASFPWLGPLDGEPPRVADWSERWSRGGFCFPVAGALDAQRAWAEPLAGTLFFAGDATAGMRHPGTVHGAIESGRRAAAQVAASD